MDESREDLPGSVDHHVGLVPGSRSGWLPGQRPGWSSGSRPGLPHRGTDRAVERDRWDVLVAFVLAGVVIGVEIALHTRIGRPLWYDELWRPHFAGEPAARFWSELGVANAPSSLGSIALTRLAGELLGWHAWSLRLVGSVGWLPVLAAGTYLTARRFMAVIPALGAALAMAGSGTVVDSGTQLKPYVLDAVVTLAILALWSAPGHRPRNRTLAGTLTLVSLPAVFLLLPLVVRDVIRERRGAWRSIPALVIAGIHVKLFVGHQSGQRVSHFWDDQFLADRGLLGGLRFVADQVRATLGGTPPGIDRYDPNLVHSLLEGHRTLTTVVGVATTVAVVVGIRVLWRRPGGATLLAALGGAQLLVLAASGARYWPFGACRTNLFVVPLLVIVAAAGADELLSTARRRITRRAASGGQPTSASTATAVAVDAGAATTATGGADPGGTAPASSAVAAVACVLCLVGLVAVPVSAVGGLGQLWRERGAVRPIDGMVAATVAARAQYRPGDTVVVGGRLARAGWLYGMELSDDTGGTPTGRIPRSATTFLPAIGDQGGTTNRAGTTRPGDVAAAVRSRPPRAGGGVLLFVLAYDRRGTALELAELRRDGWCTTSHRTFELTGTLYGLRRCPTHSTTSTARTGPAGLVRAVTAVSAQ
ncbi:hypothetical protein [Frankia sp. R82]|uniref:hypothetical protein n=1 Tax=Frankia sp. R82 TaxID=2950553 RepID=UPI002043B8B1|nr:hypothetical protein [Frankia sp. R82]MCM3883006.1 hypothetical protein [Frankia sp. R82]